MKALEKATRALRRTGFKFKKRSPEIMVVAGALGTVVSAVLACKATLKVNDILEESKETVDAIHQIADKPEKDRTEKELSYSEDDVKHDLIIVYRQTAWKLAKLYGPSVLLGALSISSILMGHHILTKRNMALAAAYTAVDQSFKEYRKNVVDRFGTEMDNELRYNLSAHDVDEPIVAEDGTETIEKKNVNTTNAIDCYSEYAKFFDASCHGWEKDPEYNLAFLRAQESYATDLLRTRGHLLLNDVYDMLGIRRTKAGMVIGWIYDGDSEHPTMQNRVDFGIYNKAIPANADFVNGYEPVIILDFNVDGNVYNMM